MKKEFYSPNDFYEGNDSERIQMAIESASRSGVNKVIIPCYNKKTEKHIWNIDREIRLPSDMTVILDNCHMRMVDGAMSQMFCNSNAYTEIGNTELGEQKNIRIKGIGNAVLDGGMENGLNERTACQNGFPHATKNVTIYMHNVSNFEMDGFTIRDQRYWGFEFIFARHGSIKNIHFEITCADSTKGWRNQDGIDLRIGCSDILIENITGQTGDDCIALTALTNRRVKKELVEGRDTCIHDVIIQNIRCYCNMCSVVRLLAQQENKIYNISLNNIFDASIPGKTSKPQFVLMVGQDTYYEGEDERASAGAISNISATNIYSRALSAIHLESAVKNFHASNVYVHSDGHHAITFGGIGIWNIYMFEPCKLEELQQEEMVVKSPERRLIAENIQIDNIYYTAKSLSKKFIPALFLFSNVTAKNVCINKIHCDKKIDLVKFFDDSNREKIFIDESPLQVRKNGE